MARTNAPPTSIVRQRAIALNEQRFQKAQVKQDNAIARVGLRKALKGMGTPGATTPPLGGPNLAGTQVSTGGWTPGKGLEQGTPTTTDYGAQIRKNLADLNLAGAQGQTLPTYRAGQLKDQLSVQAVSSPESVARLGAEGAVGSAFETATGVQNAAYNTAMGAIRSNQAAAAGGVEVARVQGRTQRDVARHFGSEREAVQRERDKLTDQQMEGYAAQLTSLRQLRADERAQFKQQLAGLKAGYELTEEAAGQTYGSQDEMPVQVLKNARGAFQSAATGRAKGDDARVAQRTLDQVLKKLDLERMDLNNPDVKDTVFAAWLEAMGIVEGQGGGGRGVEGADSGGLRAWGPGGGSEIGLGS